ncbi:MAG: glycosyltransferase family 87 protein [Phocaeicola sp.]
MQLSAIERFFKHPFFSSYRTLLGLWVLLPLISGLIKINKCNNFLIFKYVYWHVVEQLSLYQHYPEHYFDRNHYGPFFSLVVAPFALLPHPFGLIFWLIGMSVLLYYAIKKLPLLKAKILFIYWFCTHELLTALFMSQFNIVIAAIIIATFYCIQKEKDVWATLFILIGTFVKLYGIVGLAFFFFSKQKKMFIISFLGWSILLFLAPMAISSPEYIVSQYQEWFLTLSSKGGDNLFALHQNISLLGMIRKITHVSTYSDLWVIIPGLALFALPYLRISQYKYDGFRYALLSSVLLFVVLFSTGSESSSYIIALLGVAIWYVTAPWKRSKWDVALMIFAFILTSMSPSDLFPVIIRRTFVQPYALKALPCVLIWFKICYEICLKDYSPSIPLQHEERKEE